MSDRKYYVLCDMNCKFEGMTKEQILAAIEQATSTGEIKDVDTGFVTKLKESNKNAALSFWVGTQAEYNALETITENCFYIISDDTSGEDFDTAFAELKEEVEALADANSKNSEQIKMLNSNRSKALYENVIGVGNLEDIKFNEEPEKYSLLLVMLAGETSQQADGTVDYRGTGNAILRKGTIDSDGNVMFDGLASALLVYTSPDQYMGNVVLVYDTKRKTATVSMNMKKCGEDNVTNAFKVVAIYGIC
jgi:hypothetical protein